MVEGNRENGTENIEWLMETVLRLRSIMMGLVSALTEKKVTYISVVAGVLVHVKISVLEEEGRALSEK